MSRCRPQQGPAEGMAGALSGTPGLGLRAAEGIEAALAPWNKRDSIGFRISGRAQDRKGWRDLEHPARTWMG
jgi:hypothetical protein